MPLQPVIGRLCNFLQGFLDLVFAEIASARRRPRHGRRRWDGSWRRRSAGRRLAIARRGRRRPRCDRESPPAVRECVRTRDLDSSRPQALRTSSSISSAARSFPSPASRTDHRARASRSFRIRRPLRAACLRSAAPCRADSARRRGSGSP